MIKNESFSLEYGQSVSLRRYPISLRGESTESYVGDSSLLAGRRRSYPLGDPGPSRGRYDSGYCSSKIKKNNSTREYNKSLDSFARSTRSSHRLARGFGVFKKE